MSTVDKMSEQTVENNYFGSEQLHNMQEKLVLFVRHLVEHGFHIDVDSQVIAQQLLANNDFSVKLHLQHSLRTLLCKNSEQWRNFDQIYCDFWLRKPKMAMVKRSPQPAKTSINALQEGTAPVSYTHLTLPTIYSV